MNKKLKILAVLGAVAVVSLGAGAAAACGGTSCKHKNVSHTEAKAATCMSAGNTEYWQCNDCKLYFTDAGCKNETELANTVVAIDASNHDYGAFEYNYTAKQYEKKCSRNTAEHVITQAAGTEEYPYLISDMKQWVEFAEAHSQPSTQKSTDCYKVTCDLDFSTANAGEKVNVYDFSGTIDFDNHKVSGLTMSNTVDPAYYVRGLFDVVHDATIKNIDFEASFFGVNGHITHLVTILLSGANVIENATMSGSAVYSENNASAFVYMVYPFYAKKDNAAYAGISQNVTLTMKDCTSKVNMNNKSGYSAAFVGTVNNGNNNDGYGKTNLNFINCKNEGTIVAYKNASVLVANPVAYKFVSGEKGNLTVKNCANEGVIYYGTAFAPVIGFNADTQKVNEDNAANIKNGANVKVASVGALGVNNGNFVIKPVTGAARYELSFSFFASKTVGGETFSGAVGKTVTVTTETQFAVLDFVNAADLEEGDYSGRADGMYVTNDGLHYVFGVDEAVWVSGSKMTSLPGVILTAYDNDGQILAISDYTYSK